MKTDLLTVDQLAQMLDMHPRTIRRYIREGQLKASKVGGEWRIRKEDAETFVGGRVAQIQKEAADDIAAYLDGGAGETDGKFRVCAILDCYVENTDEALQISEVIMRHMNDDDPSRGKAKFQYFYVAEEKKGRYVIWGGPAFVGKVLSAVGKAAK